MPPRSKADQVHRFALNVNVPPEKYPLVTKALSAVLALAGLQVQTKDDKPVSPKAAAPKPPKASRKPSPKAPQAKTAPAKAAPKTAPPAAKKPALSRSDDSPAAASPDALRKLRTRLGLSQKDIADKMGIHQNNISALETGKRSLTPEMLKRLSQVLKIPPRSLFK